MVAAAVLSSNLPSSRSSNDKLRSGVLKALVNVLTGTFLSRTEPEDLEARLNAKVVGEGAFYKCTVKNICEVKIQQSVAVMEEFSLFIR